MLAGLPVDYRGLAVEPRYSRLMRVERDDVRVLELRGQLDLAFEPLDGDSGRGGEGDGDDPRAGGGHAKIRITLRRVNCAALEGTPVHGFGDAFL